MSLTILSACVAALSAASAAEAPLPGLGKITVTATRTEADPDDVPTTVSVLTAAQLEDRLVTDIKDLVRFEPGVAVRSSPSRFTAAGASTGRDGNSGFNIRGLEGNRVLIVVDGVRVPDAFGFGAQATGRGDYVDLDILRSVEILRGSASALYGSDGLAGAVSFITQDPADLLGEQERFGARARVGYASADRSVSESVVVAGRGGPWQALLAYTRRDAHEQETQGTVDAANSSRTTPNPQDIASNAVLGKLLYEIDAAQRLRLTVDHFDRQVDSNVLSAVARPPLAATSTLALRARDDLRRDRIGLDHRFEGEEGWLASSQAAVYWQNSRIREYAAEDRNTAADRIRDNTFDNEVTGFSTQLASVLPLGRGTQRLVYGADASRTRQEGLRDGTTPPAGETFPTRAFPTTEYVLAGLYVQDEVGLADGRFVLHPALRYDYYSVAARPDLLYSANVPQNQHDSHLSARLGAVLHVGDLISLFANAGEGFKAPAPSQINNGFTNPLQNYRSISNPGLKPETSDTLEGGVRLHAGRAAASLTAFSGRYRDFIDQLQVAGNFTAASPAVYQFVNRGRVRIDGVEARAEAQLGHGFAAQAAMSHVRGEITTGGVDTPLDSVEPWKLVLGASWRDAGERFGGELIATRSAGKRSSRVSAADCPGCYTPPGFTVVDATGWWNLTAALTLRAGLFNLTDEKYWWWGDVRGQSSTSTTLDAYTQPGRNASVSVSWHP
jgi:hemoglobin/transferrin/lactoferrin receptor protein